MTYIPNWRNTIVFSTYIIDINVTQRMVGKHWMKRWCMYRWAGKTSTEVTEVNNNRGYEA